MVQHEEILNKINTVKHWYHKIEVAPGIWTPGVHDSQRALELLDLPLDCRGMKVLDIGARDGFFSFELEKRGADVVAIDIIPADVTGFQVLSDYFQSKVKFIHENVYGITKEKYGTFDIVLCLGLLYHLRDPLLALDLIREVCKGQLFLETHVIDYQYINNPHNAILTETPLMQFYPKNSFRNDYTNFWGPNMKCVEALLIESNFEIINKKIVGDRGIFKCGVSTDSQMQYIKELTRNKLHI